MAEEAGPTIERMADAAVITVSDSCSKGQRVDLSGPAGATELTAHGFDVKLRLLVADERKATEDALRSAANDIQPAITAGGTGISPYDVTREVMRMAGRKESPYMALRLEVCGSVIDSSSWINLEDALILNLPSSAAMPLLKHARNSGCAHSERPGDAH